MENTGLTENDYVRAADRLGVEVAVVKAVQQVETGGRGGFLANGKPPILFEGHIFWKELEALPFTPKLNPENYRAGNEDILYKKWERGHYKGGIKEYERLDKALALAEKIGKTNNEIQAVRAAVLKSASYGKFQILGTNCISCGYSDVFAFVEAMNESEGKQLDAFVEFIIKNKMQEALKNKDWASFAKKYNGPGYAANRYDEKLQAAYEKFV